MITIFPDEMARAGNIDYFINDERMIGYIAPFEELQANFGTNIRSPHGKISRF